MLLWCHLGRPPAALTTASASASAPAPARRLPVADPAYVTSAESLSMGSGPVAGNVEEESKAKEVSEPRDLADLARTALRAIISS